jgi:hypothetical protein
VESPASADALWLARDADVNPNRPIFTGDLFDDVEVAGQGPKGMAMVVAHPCSMRGKNGALAERVLMAPVRSYQKLPLKAWTEGHFGVFPIPGVDETAAVALDALGTAPTTALDSASRVACLSELGVNLLQQRLVMRLTRADLPTSVFHEAFSHTYEEADLLEEWCDVLSDAGRSIEEATAMFELAVREPRPAGESFQGLLRDPQQRASVRRDLRRLAQEAAGSS